jgi:hypothetical protein
VRLFFFQFRYAISDIGVTCPYRALIQPLSNPLSSRIYNSWTTTDVPLPHCRSAVHHRERNRDLEKKERLNSNKKATGNLLSVLPSHISLDLAHTLTPFPSHWANESSSKCFFSSSGPFCYLSPLDTHPLQSFSLR